MTVIKNDKNELVPTRLVTGWRVCINYRKLNEATRKDHFPLPFMDQILERLAGNEYYCFLDGFSGYFQIPIDLKDPEKTRFTCLYGTFAYKRMPFGLCNAPGTFQRCMMAIFHDMIEQTMEVKEKQENDKIGSKPNKNGKRGEAGKSLKQLQWKGREARDQILAPLPGRLRKPNIKFFRVFGCRCYLLNDYENVGKLKAKGDIRVFIGYSKESAAFRIYNKQTRKIHESVNVIFDEISEMASKQFSLEPGLSNLNETRKSSNPSVPQVSEASKKDLEDLFQKFYDEYFDSSKIMNLQQRMLKLLMPKFPRMKKKFFMRVLNHFKRNLLLLL
nr:reverse transcriptase domain-containing protein [Tanacetum cinerariifolium]